MLPFSMIAEHPAYFRYKQLDVIAADTVAAAAIILQVFGIPRIERCVLNGHRRSIRIDVNDNTILRISDEAGAAALAPVDNDILQVKFKLFVKL